MLCVCVCVCMYVCVCVCIVYVYMYCMCVYVYTYVCFVCVYVCMYVYMYVCVVCMYVCMCACIYMYVCVCVLRMYICMYYFMCVCMYEYMYVRVVCIYVCVYACMYIYMCCMYICMYCMYVCVVCTYVYISQNFSKFMLVPYILNIITMQYHYNDFLCQTLSMYATDVAESFVRSVYPVCLVTRSDVNRSICSSLKVQCSAARVYKTVSVCLAFNCRWSDVTCIEYPYEASSLIQLYIFHG